MIIAGINDTYLVTDHSDKFVFRIYSFNWRTKAEINEEIKLLNLLKKYESMTPKSAEEKRLIPALGLSLYFFYLGIQCQRYENWSNSFLNENYLKRFINGLVKKYHDLYKSGEKTNG